MILIKIHKVEQKDLDVTLFGWTVDTDTNKYNKNISYPFKINYEGFDETLCNHMILGIINNYEIFVHESDINNKLINISTLLHPAYFYWNCPVWNILFNPKLPNFDYKNELSKIWIHILNNHYQKLVNEDAIKDIIV